MVPNKQQPLTEQCVKIQLLQEEGKTMKKIAEKLKISSNGVRCILQRLKETGTVQDKKRSGTPRKTSPRQAKHLKFLNLHGRRKSNQQLTNEMRAGLNINISSSTVHRGWLIDWLCAEASTVCGELKKYYALLTCFMLCLAITIVILGHLPCADGCAAPSLWVLGCVWGLVCVSWADYPLEKASLPYRLATLCLLPLHHSVGLAHIHILYNKTQSCLSPINGGNNQSALTKSITPGG